MISDQTIEMLDHPLSGTKIVVVGKRSEGRLLDFEARHIEVDKDGNVTDRCSTDCWLAENTVPVPEEWRRERP